MSIFTKGGIVKKARVTLEISSEAHISESFSHVQRPDLTF